MKDHLHFLYLIPVFLLLWIGCESDGCDTLVIEDFEGHSFHGWHPAGNAFSSGPMGVGTPHEMVGTLGAGFAASVDLEDAFAKGTLTSLPFRIRRNSIHFLISSHEIFYRNITTEQGRLMSIQLLMGDQVVRETFPDEFHAMFWRSWDVTEFRDRDARIRIVDDDPREWAHIDIDQIIQNDLPPGGKPISRSVLVDKPILNLPVDEDGERNVIGIFHQDRQVRELDIALARDVPDYWVMTDLSPWLGEEIEIRTMQITDSDPCLLDKLVLAEDLLGSEDLYREPMRQQFHFSSKRGWINDPNGLVYYDGEFHLFYQHNPYGWDHSRNDYNKTWGHAVSTDLIHWQELPGKIHPDHLGPIYSGSAVVDFKNTTGFKTGEEDPIVCIYTSAGGRSPWSMGKKFTQSLAYSNDRGRTFTIYDGNPVQPNLDYINRDPKAIWYEPSEQWVIVLHFDERAMVFFTSQDLKTWEYQSELQIERLVDCPELFQLPVDGDPNRLKWILYGGPGDYIIGEFDGKRFFPETEEIRFHFGNGFYASQTFNNVPESDGRRIQMAWGLTETPGMPFNQSMLFPVELSLRSTESGPRMFAYPVEEIALLCDETHTWKELDVAEGTDILTTTTTEFLDINADFTIKDAVQIGFGIKGTSVIYDVQAQKLICDELSASMPSVNGKIRLRILVDRLTLEIFGNDGQVYMPMSVVHSHDGAGLDLIVEGGTTFLNLLEVHELRSIWL